MQNMTEQERVARAAENEKASQEAQRIAADLRQQDILNGQKPVTSEIADRLKDRLVKEDFTPKE